MVFVGGGSGTVVLRRTLRDLAVFTSQGFICSEASLELTVEVGMRCLGHFQGRFRKLGLCIDPAALGQPRPALCRTGLDRCLGRGDLSADPESSLKARSKRPRSVCASSLAQIKEPL